MQGISLSVVMIGVSMLWRLKSMLLVIISLVIGGVAGQAAGIEDKLDSWKLYAKKAGRQ